MPPDVASFRTYFDEPVRGIHQDYLAALNGVAVENGRLTNTERDQLDSVANLLELVEASAAGAAAG